MTLTDTTPTDQGSGGLADGRVVGIAGPVIDVEFPRGSLPELNAAIEFDVELDAGQGLRATGRKASLEISGVLDRRQFAAPNFQLGDSSAALSNVYLPCSTGRLTEFGVEWPGAATMYAGPRGPASSAFVAVAESWAL